MGTFKEKLQSKEEFVITCEFVPGRGLKGASVDAVIEFARQVKERNLPVDALSITDNPGGNPAISPDVLGQELLKMGIEPLIHFSCANANRNIIEARAFALARQGINNLLVVTGDYPTSGYRGTAKPVFDLDSVQLIDYLRQMNQGLKVPGRKKGTFETLPATNFAIGCAVSPFKKTEEEYLTQLFKLEKKIAAGADFVIPQLGYDIRKFVEIVKYLKYRNLEVPILGNVYVVSLMVAKLMNKNLVPGCVVTDEFLKKLTEEAKSPDKGKQARLERAGQLVAIFKGLGFNGVHIGGFGLKVSDVEFIINRAREIGNGWRGYLGNFQYPQKDEFYLFPPDDDFSFAPEKLTPNMGKKFSKSPSLQIMKLFHNLMFESIGYQVGKRFYPWLEKRKVLDKVCHQLEKFSKQLLFDCQDCGDCALPDLSYLCPMSRCAKFQRNGPCGGSYQGWCEVYPDEKKCVWTLIYQRLAGEGKLNQIREEFVPPADGKLIRTSSWGNFFLGRDHTSKKLKELKEKK